MTGVPVTIWQQVPLQDGTSRAVALSQDGQTLHVGIYRPGTDAMVSELSFEVSEALAMAKACLSGHARALTTPGLTRMLCASVLVLGVAAFKAGGLAALPLRTDGTDEPGDFPDRGEAQGDGVDDG